MGAGGASAAVAPAERQRGSAGVGDGRAWCCGRAAPNSCGLCASSVLVEHTSKRPSPLQLAWVSPSWPMEAVESTCPSRHRARKSTTACDADMEIQVSGFSQKYFFGGTPRPLGRDDSLVTGRGVEAYMCIPTTLGERWLVGPDVLYSCILPTTLRETGLVGHHSESRSYITHDLRRKWARWSGTLGGNNTLPTTLREDRSRWSSQRESIIYYPRPLEKEGSLVRTKEIIITHDLQRDVTRWSQRPGEKTHLFLY